VKIQDGSMKRFLQFAAGLVLMISMVGCHFTPGYYDPCTGFQYGGIWVPDYCHLLDPCFWCHGGLSHGSGWGNPNCCETPCCDSHGGCGAGCETFPTYQNFGPYSEPIPTFSVPAGPPTPLGPPVNPSPRLNPNVSPTTLHAPSARHGRMRPVRNSRKRQWIPARY
jgi:hypothetical protein